MAHNSDNFRILNQRSPAYVFASELIEEVFQRKMPVYKLPVALRVPQNESLLPVKTRRYAHYYLNKFELDLYFAFAKCFEAIMIDDKNFLQFLTKLKATTHTIRSNGDLLRMAICISSFAECAFVRGAFDAPYISLICLYSILEEYTIRKDPDFFNNLEAGSTQLLENYIINRDYIFEMAQLSGIG